MTTSGSEPERSIPLALPKVWGARPRRAISRLAWRTCSRSEARSMADFLGGAGGAESVFQISLAAECSSAKSNSGAGPLTRCQRTESIFHSACSPLGFPRKCVMDGNYLGAVNLHPVRASTCVMAAGTALEPMTRATAEEIAARKLEAATDEFSLVVERHRPQIFRFLLASTRDVDLAETLTQECFLKAHRNWGSFRGESSAMTWLMRIAINLQKDNWRNRRLQFWRQTQTNSVDMDEAGEWLPSGESSVEKQLLAREQVGHVWRAVKGLSERQRTVFLLRYIEEQELSEIARATGLSEGTVKAHLSRALVRVRAELGGRR